MRFTLIASALLAATTVDAFAPSLSVGRSVAPLKSTVEAAVSPAEFNSKLEAQLAKMAAKDANSKISADVSSLQNMFESVA